jgi:hypothetical protein
MKRLALPLLCTTIVLATTPLSAATCMNKFLRRSEGQKQVITFLTGKLTYEEAKTVAQAIAKHQAEPFQWVDEKGKVLAKNFGPLQVVRPMPVGCDGKTSGVVLMATFMSVTPPSKKMLVRIDPSTTVDFAEQSSE